MRLLLPVVFFSAAWSAAGLASPQDALSLRNFREIPAALEVATGLAARDDAVRALVGKLQSRLPQAGVAAEMSSPMLLALTELGDAFCATAIARERPVLSGSRRLARFVDFSRGPSQFTPSFLQRFLPDLARRFWQRQPTAEELSVLASIVASTAAAGVDNPSETPRVLLALCVVLASSLEFLTL